MFLDSLHKIGWFAGLVLLQVLVLNHVHVGGYATPFLYVYFVLALRSDMPRNAAMLWAFALGLTVDVFSDTAGMNAAATVLLAFVRPVFLRLFVPREFLEGFSPTIRVMGMLPFVKYMAACVFLHHAFLIGLEYFSTAHIGSLLLSVVASLCACGASGVAGGSLLLIPLACNMFGISNDIAMQVVAVGFIIGVLQDSCETALNSSTDVLFTAAACQAEDDRLANSALRN